MMKLNRINRMFIPEGFYSAFRFNWNEHFAFSGESHDFWEAVFVEDGNVEVTEDENVYILGAGNIIFHAPLEFHRIKSAMGSSPRGFIMTFAVSGNLPPSIMDGVFSLDAEKIREYKEICEKAYRFIREKSSPLLSQELSDLLSVFIIKLSASSSSDASYASRSACEYRRIVTFMNKNVYNNLTLSDIAQKNNVSLSYIKLLFSKYAGVSPKHYYNKLRLGEADTLLASGLSVSEVSYKMNFSSPNYFSAFYKKNTKKSPKEKFKNG